MNFGRTYRCLKSCLRIKKSLNLSNLYSIHSVPQKTLPHVLNFSVNGVDFEALTNALKDSIEISNVSACTSTKF